MYRQEWVEPVPASLGYLGEFSVATAALQQLQERLKLYADQASEIYVSL